MELFPFVNFRMLTFCKRGKDEYRSENGRRSETATPRFVVSGEISSIYKQDGKVRKVHSLILLPDLEDAQRLSAKLEMIGNIHSDGRPILGLSCHDLLEVDAGDLSRGNADTSPYLDASFFHVWCMLWF